MEKERKSRDQQFSKSFSLFVATSLSCHWMSCWEPGFAIKFRISRVSTAAERKHVRPACKLHAESYMPVAFPP